MYCSEEYLLCNCPEAVQVYGSVEKNSAEDFEDYGGMNIVSYSAGVAVYYSPVEAAFVCLGAVDEAG